MRQPTVGEFFDYLSCEQRDELRDWMEGQDYGMNVPALRRKGLVGMWEPYSYVDQEWRSLNRIDNPS